MVIADETFLKSSRFVEYLKRNNLYRIALRQLSCKKEGRNLAWKINFSGNHP
jgi:hypothetical protein